MVTESSQFFWAEKKHCYSCKQTCNTYEKLMKQIRYQHKRKNVLLADNSNCLGALLLTKFNFNTLGPRQNGRHFADDIFKRIFVNENVWILIWISLKFVPKGPINNIPALVQIMVWCRAGDKPLSEQMIVSLPTHICVTRPQWVNPSMDK